MTAIQRARLNRQLLDLCERFDEPEEFLRALDDILDFYAEHTLRLRSAVEAAPLLRNYHVPPQLLREIEKALAPHVDAGHPQAFALADALWASPCLETRLLAIWILGRLPVKPSEPVLTRVREWSAGCREDRIIDALVRQGLRRLRLDAEEEFIALLEGWLQEGEPQAVHLGLRALLAWLEESGYENSPTIFRWLTPLTRAVTLATKEDLRQVLSLLIRQTPQESAFFLQQILALPPSRELLALGRQLLAEFPPEQREALRPLLRQRPKEAA